MHELSVAMSLIEAVEEEAERHEGRVHTIHLKLGPLFGVVKEALVSAFEMAREGTPIAEARLVVEETPVVIYCSRCQARQPIASVEWFCCPVCKTPSSEVVSGKELELVALEIE
ncbi:MAG TPA: hydrogenase maturation nickel metallochaperone HypA [Bryobacteraceae bacterium]|jgi:hydrogenase nickel incorporation protein HypA/HybF|nr:hydrogenase maturation nickel metallochaperone HypA [Bryobacteraceae bacterium]